MIVHLQDAPRAAASVLLAAPKVPPSSYSRTDLAEPICRWTDGLYPVFVFSAQPNTNQSLTTRRRCPLTLNQEQSDIA